MPSIRSRPQSGVDQPASAFLPQRNIIFASPNEHTEHTSISTMNHASAPYDGEPSQRKKAVHVKVSRIGWNLGRDQGRVLVRLT